MPIIQSKYQAPLLFQNPHFATIYASAYRKVGGINYTRERLELPDGDFIDLDWSLTDLSTNSDTNSSSNSDINKKTNANGLVIITHGFLGNSNRQYVKGTVKLFNLMGWDALAWNHRGLSGEPNRLEKLTTHGSTDELSAIVDQVLKSRKYQNIALVGWSKGGNITLKYAAQYQQKLAPEIRAIVGISMPTDIYGSVQVMGKTSFYANRFRDKTFKFLKNRKHLINAEKFAEFNKYKLLDDFTDWYIAPLHGYKDARDYYVKCSVIDYLEQIKVPTLILNSIDDPILSLTCSPFQLAKNSEIIHLENPKHGGHCAFYESDKNGIYWAEKRAYEFIIGYVEK